MRLENIMTKLITFATVLNVLSQPALGNGLLWMARAMSGEQSGVFPESMRDEIGLWIAHTILNRVQSEAYPNEPEAVVRQGFYGHSKANEIDQFDQLKRMYHLAFQAVITRTLANHDVTDGCYFMYSLHDLTDLNLSKASDTAVRCFENGEWGLCFFKEMP
jgi:hypothetical protein